MDYTNVHTAFPHCGPFYKMVAHQMLRNVTKCTNSVQCGKQWQPWPTGEVALSNPFHLDSLESWNPSANGNKFLETLTHKTNS